MNKDLTNQYPAIIYHVKLQYQLTGSFGFFWNQLLHDTSMVLLTRLGFIAPWIYVPLFQPRELAAVLQTNIKLV